MWPNRVLEAVLEPLNLFALGAELIRRIEGFGGGLWCELHGVD